MHPEKDKSATLGFNLPAGTWFGTVKVEDQNFWNEFVKTGQVKGFSVEGLFAQEIVKNCSIESDELEGLEEFGADKSEFELGETFSIDPAEWDFICEHGIEKEELAAKKDNPLGLQKFYQYYGPLDDKTRKLCLKLLGVGKIYSAKDIKALTAKYGFPITQKIAGRTNCRHTFTGIFAKKKTQATPIPIQDYRNEIFKVMDEHKNSLQYRLKEIKETIEQIIATAEEQLPKKN